MSRILVISQFIAKPGKEKETADILREMSEFSHTIAGVEASQISFSPDNPSLFLTYSIYTSADSYEEMKKVFQNDLSIGKKYMALTDLLDAKPINQKFKILN